jgi:subtilisin family serine protease
MWNLRAIRWQDARNRSGFVPAENIKVAVLDTGIDRHHPDLGPRVKGYMYSHPDLPVTASDRDIIGHGTHVSGTIAALINNNLGINGISEAQIWMWKIFPDREEFTGRAFEFIVDPVMYQRALSDCIEQGVAAVNLSIGGSGAPDPNEQQLFNLLLSRGTIVVAAMGNEFEEGNPVEYPAAIPGVIAVGATSLDDTRASFSNMGNHIALCAPGVGIWSTLPTYAGRLGHRAIPGPSGLPRRGPAIPRDTNYASWDGTSMATPHVTGSVALLRANKGHLNPSEARLALMRTADKVAGMDGSDFTSDYGAGRLNLERLLA